jgi:Carboxypeptidase regulatory-like domain
MKSIAYCLPCELDVLRNELQSNFVGVRVPGRKAMIAFAIRLLGLVIILAISSSLLKAQSFYGSIVGIVADPTGAVVPDATVTATNIGTSEAQTVQSDAGGKFSFVNLVPAVYRVEVAKTNFKHFVGDQLTVEVGAVVRVDPVLQVGTANETVVVSTQALLQTDTSSVSTVITGAEVQQMPLNGRNVMNLIALAPGVVPTGGSQGDTGLNQGTRTGGGAGWGNYEIGGAIQGQSAQYLDGVPNNLLGGNIVALVPTQDAIQEFSVASSNATADFGRFSGGVVNMTTKSGTNAFHGSAWEYFRNRDLNANDYFSNLSGQPRVQWNQNQYGAAINGPIKRDKAFFMFTWEGFRALTGNVSTTLVPTAAMQNGVFDHEIADPSGNCKILASGGTWTITNLYQGACGDPLNRVLKTYYPAPNASGQGFNWYLASPLGNKQNQYNARVDYTLSNRQRIFGRYTYWTLLDSPAHSEFGEQGYDGAKWPTNDGHVEDLTHQAVLGDTITFNPTTLLDVRVNYVRQFSPNYPDSTTVDETQFDKYNPNKYYTALGSQMSVHGLPGFGLNGNYGFYGLANFPGYSINWYNTYGINANLVKIVGAHTIKFGTELRLMDGSGTGFDNTESGQYQYYNTSIANGWVGDEWAAFLMGYPQQITFTTINSTAPYTYYSAFYATDNWQATRNLTLNLGLRYELPGAISERKNRAYVLLPSVNDPVQTAVQGTLQLVDSPLYHHRSTVIPAYNLFAPRLGFAYRAEANTVVRGGYGITYLPSDISGGTSSGLFSYNQSINAAQTQINISSAGAPVPLQTKLGDLVASGLNQPIGRTHPDIIGYQGLASTTSFLNKSITGPVPNQPYPYTQQWNIGISHQFKGNTVAEITYTGLKGTHIPGIYNNSGRNLNQIPDSDDSLGTALNNPAVSCGSAPGLVGSHGFNVGQCDRPFPYYNNVQDSAGWYARQNYSSFQARAEKRMGAGGVLNANYTWSKNMGNTDTQNGFIESKATQQGGNGSGEIQDWNNLAAEYSLISFDVTNRVIVSYVLNLPFGKGQRFGNSFNNTVSTVVSGWAVNGITDFQSGFPVYFATGTQNQLTNFGAGITRPNRVPGCNPVIGGSGLDRVKSGGWFNTACFTYPGDYSFGNEPRVDPQVRADGVKNFDFSLQKSTTLHESANLEFRAEFFNIFNRVQFAPPIGTQGASNFGDVTYQVNKPRQLQLSLRLNF